MGALTTGLLFLFLAVVILIRVNRPILIESLESKTISGQPVFNRIAWFPGWSHDTWMMQQSHQGLFREFHQWDRLAIVVDKTTRPRTARFYQFEPGNLSWDPQSKMRPFRAACFMCHSNGPRAIRPNFDSDNIRLSALDRARVFLWDLRIKTYGRVLADPAHALSKDEEALASAGKMTPFRYPGKDENEPLHLSSCIKCHNESWWGRGSLTRQHFATIGFMVENGFMPPPGFRLKESEKGDLRRFIRGLPISVLTLHIASTNEAPPWLTRNQPNQGVEDVRDEQWHAEP